MKWLVGLVSLLGASSALGAEPEPGTDLQELPFSEMGLSQELWELQLSTLAELHTGDGESLRLALLLELGILDDLQVELEIFHDGQLNGFDGFETAPIELGLMYRLVELEGLVVSGHVEAGIGDESELAGHLIVHPYWGRCHLQGQIGVEAELDEEVVRLGGTFGGYCAVGDLTGVAELEARDAEDGLEVSGAAGLAVRPASGYEIFLAGVLGLWGDDDALPGTGGLLLIATAEWPLYEEEDDDGDGDELAAAGAAFGLP